MLAFRAFFDPRFHLFFQFLRSVDLNIVNEKMSQRPYPQPQLHVGLVSADLFGSFWPVYVQ